MPEDTRTVMQVVAEPSRLGLSAPTAEMIRDFLTSDLEDLKRDLADLQRAHGYAATAIERLAGHIEATETIALDLMASCIEGNSKTFIEKVS